jgi:hypothetical protein
MSVYFAVDSDVHFANRDGVICIRPDKALHVERLKALKKSYNLQAVVVPGDLTMFGSNGKKIGCIPISGEDKELQGFVEQYQQPLEEAGIAVCENIGNHDV